MWMDISIEWIEIETKSLIWFSFQRILVKYFNQTNLLVQLLLSWLCDFATELFRMDFYLS